MVENEFPILYTLGLRKSSSRCQTGWIKLKQINTQINKTFLAWGIRRQHGKKEKKSSWFEETEDRVLDDDGRKKIREKFQKGEIKGESSIPSISQI